MRFWFDLAIILLGFFSARFLLYRIPRLPAAGGARQTPPVSVIIPARNEEKTLPVLLESLQTQTLPPLEILVVDDASTDGTAQAARTFGAALLSPPEKPADWVGKSWACQFGADKARGEILLFLDADVSLAPDALARFAAADASCGCPFSVQPYHAVVRAYEQLTLFFNLIQIAANGTALKKPAPLGLYGPVVWISRERYAQIGGHAAVKDSIVEDMALGTRLRDRGVPFRLFVGDGDVRFRMYPDGLKSLLQGFTKNISAGAARTPLWLFLPVFLMIASLAGVPIGLVKAALNANLPLLLLYAGFYGGWAAVLRVVSRRIGSFSIFVCALYPVPLLAFFGVFLVSVFKRILGMRVVWKGRTVRPGR